MFAHAKGELISNILETVLSPSPGDDVVNDAVCFQLSLNKPLRKQWAKLDGQCYSVPVLATGRIVDKTKQVDTASVLKNCHWELLGSNLSQDRFFFFNGFPVPSGKCWDNDHFVSNHLQFINYYIIQCYIMYIPTLTINK